MSWRVVARKELREARQGELIPYALLFVALHVGLVWVLFRNAPSGSAPDVSQALVAVAFVVPLAGVMVAHESVARERASGSMRVLLPFAETRRAVVVGKFAACWCVLAVVLAAGAAAGLVVAVVQTGTLPSVDALLVFALSVLLAGTYVGLTVAVSAATASTNRALVGSLLALAGSVAWDTFPTVARYAATGFRSPPGPPPGWMSTYRRLDPVTGYESAIGPVIGGGGNATLADATFGVAVLAAWAAVAVAIGAWRFDRADL